MIVDKRYYTLITGASAGIGRAMAVELSRRGHNLVLTALPGTGLDDLCCRLAEENGIKAHCLETDMTAPEAPSLIKKFTASQGITIDILVNNVGIGHGGEIGSYSDASIMETIFLNMRSATLLTNLYIEELKSCPSAFILNMGSFSGFTPMPFKSIYAASKAYIYNFSLSVREELHGTGVSVSVAMPGPVMTNHKVRERVTMKGKKALMTAIEPDVAAREITRQLFKGKAVIIPGRSYKFLYTLSSLMPYGLLMRMIRNTFKGIN